MFHDSVCFPIEIISHIVFHYPFNRFLRDIIKYLWLDIVYFKLVYFPFVHKLQFSSLIQSCLTLCMDCITPGFPVLHQLLELALTHVHWVSDGIQPSHPLLFSSPPTFNLSQHQGLFQWVSSSHQMAKILEFQLQHQSSNEHSGLISFEWTGWISLLSKGLKSLLHLR